MPTSAYLPTFNRSPSVDHQSPAITPTYPIYSNTTTTTLTRDQTTDFNSLDDLLTLKEDDLQVAIALRPTLQASLEDLSAQAIVALEALTNASSLSWTTEASAMGRRDSDIEAPLDQTSHNDTNDEDQLSKHRQNVHLKQSHEVEIAIETVTDSIRSVLFSTGILNSAVSIKSLPSSMISLRATQRRLIAALSKCTLTSEAIKSILCFLPVDESGQVVRSALEQMNEDVIDLQNILQDFIESALDVKDGLPSRQILAVLGPRSESAEIKHITNIRRRREMGKPTLLQLEQLGGDAREALRSINQALALMKQDEEVIDGDNDTEEAQPDSDLEVDPDLTKDERSKPSKPNKPKEEKKVVKTINKLPSSLLPSIQSCLVTLTKFCNATDEVDVLPMLDFDGLPPPTHPPDSPILGQDDTPPLSANDSHYQELVRKAHSYLHEFEKAKISLTTSSGNALVQLQDLISMNLSEVEVCEALIGCISKDIFKIESSSSDVLESLLSLVEIADTQYQLTSNNKLSGSTQIGKRALQLSKLDRASSIKSAKSAGLGPNEAVADDDSDLEGMDPGANIGNDYHLNVQNRQRSDSAASPHTQTLVNNQMLLSQSTNTQVVSVEELQEQHRLAQRQKVDKLLGENSQESLPSNISSLGRDQRPSQSSTGSGPKEHFLSSDFGSSLIIQPNGSVKGGTLPALVERLTTHEHTGEC